MNCNLDDYCGLIVFATVKRRVSHELNNLMLDSDSKIWHRATHVRMQTASSRRGEWLLLDITKDETTRWTMQHEP